MNGKRDNEIRSMHEVRICEIYTHTIKSPNNKQNYKSLHQCLGMVGNVTSHMISLAVSKGFGC